MKFYPKLLMHLLDYEINELVAKMQPRNGMFFAFRNNELMRSLINATTDFRENMIRLLHNSDSDDATFETLSNLLPEFQQNMDNIREYHCLRHVDYISKMFHLTRMIKSECTNVLAWDIEYDEFDPLCIFKYKMLAYIIENSNSRIHDEKIQIIKAEFDRIKDYYAALTSNSARFDFIHSSLQRISRNEVAINRPPTLPAIGLFGISLNIQAPVSTSSLQRVIESIDRTLRQAAHHLEIPGALPALPRTHEPIQRPVVRKEKAPEIKGNSLPVIPRRTNQERYEALASTDELKALGYKREVVNEAWYCGISLDIVNDPVSSGSSFKGIYERKDLERWVRQSGTDPNTREKITLDHITPMPHVQQQIEQFLSEQEARKKYFEQCLERGLKTQEEAMAVVLR